MKKKNAFTLIELIAVLVILAVIALIVTPLVMNVVKKAKTSADKRSVDGYGKSIETAIAEYLIDTGKNPKKIEDLDIKYSGSKVSCETRVLNRDRTVFLTGCSVEGREVKDDSTSDGYYHYGKPNYTVYNIGDVVTYNGMDFYVIANSDETSDSVTLLKAEPLTVDEVNTYGIGHINNYTNSSVGTAYDQNGYGGMAYYTSETCGYVNDSWIYDGCTTDYDVSEVKYVVDTWSNDKLRDTDLKKDSLGYKTRLITIEELKTNLGYIYHDSGTGSWYIPSESTPSFVYNSNYSYWTMSSLEDSDSAMWGVITYGDLTSTGVYQNDGSAYRVIRPVITLKKFVIE